MNAQLFDLLGAELLPVATTSQAKAAVILLLSCGDETALLYTKRAQHLRSHPGEVCFPGGMREPGDRDLLNTALREMEEEIGLSAIKVKVLGCLPEAQTRAGTLVVPFVACVDPDNPLTPSPAELDAVFWVPLAGFKQGLKVRDDQFERNDRSYTIPVYHYQGYEIWGFTAAITAELLQVLRNIQSL